MKKLVDIDSTEAKAQLDRFNVWDELTGQDARKKEPNESGAASLRRRFEQNRLKLEAQPAEIERTGGAT